MAQLSDVQVDEDGEFSATVEFEDGTRVPVEFGYVEDFSDDNDEDVVIAELEFEEIRDIVEQSLGHLTPTVFEDTERVIVQTLVDAEYEDDDEDAEDEEYEDLADALALDTVLVLSDGRAVLLYLAEDYFDGETIFAQLDDEFEIEELSVG